MTRKNHCRLSVLRGWASMFEPESEANRVTCGSIEFSSNPVHQSPCHVSKYLLDAETSFVARLASRSHLTTSNPHLHCAPCDGCNLSSAFDVVCTMPCFRTAHLIHSAWCRLSRCGNRAENIGIVLESYQSPNTACQVAWLRCGAHFLAPRLSGFILVGLRA